MTQPIPRDARIYVSGHRGLVGSAVVRHLREAGFDDIATATREEVDLRDPRAVDELFDTCRPQYVIHAAGTVGGIQANIDRPVDFLHDNLMMAATVLRSAWRTGVLKLLYLASSCVYPRECPQPMRESMLLSGPLEPTNEPYALAKLAGIKACQAYRRQHGANFISAMPCNVYGPGDHFEPDRSHVLAALVGKFHEAKSSGLPSVTVWGTGRPRRELLYVDDLADACLFLLEHYDDVVPVNVGTGEDVTIAELAELVRDAIYPEAIIEYDRSRPDGVPRKLLDVSRIRSLGWRHRTKLREGIERTYRWFVEHEANT